MTNEGEVYFRLFCHETDPIIISNEIGIKPTSIKHKAHPIPRHSEWIYSSGKINNDYIDVYQLATSIVSDLEPYADDIKAVKDKYAIEAVLEVVLTFSNDDSVSTPAIGFDSEVIQFLNYVGATIDIDTYLE